MNDPGTGAAPDPLFNPQYSQFCYEIPFMPGQTQYMDTPVVPTSAFAGAGYNNPDCNYPALTPAIKEVDGDGVGPWVAGTSGHVTFTVTALEDTNVPNNGYSGPSATAAPFNEKTVPRHYGFGATKGTVTIGTYAVPAASITTWNDTTIVFTVPLVTATGSNVPLCSLQQQAQYGGSNARCGELSIATADGKQSIDTVTVTVGGKSPTHVAASGSVQSAIDAALPGDLIIVDPTCTATVATTTPAVAVGQGVSCASTANQPSKSASAHTELLLMWKPVRLQGVGAFSSVLNANTQPAGKMDPWRAKVDCLFGLSRDGQPISNGSDVPKPGYNLNHAVGFEPPNAYDSTGQYTCGTTNGIAWAAFNGKDNNPQVDRLPLEAVVGWDTTLNGNLAELLQEPSLMGAFEGAGITVLAKGVRYPSGVEVFGTGQDTTAGANIAHEGQMPLGTVLLTGSAADCNTLGTGAKTGYSSNFNCNPSRIDGLSITDSSQGGGGIFAHAWAHNLEISNNRIYNNTGTLTGGIDIGQGESPDALLAGNGGDPLASGNPPAGGGFDQQPWTCVPGAVTGSIAAGFTQVPIPPGFTANDELPFCYNTYVNIHNNAVSQNSSIGDEVFSGTPAGAGGISLAPGADFYKVNYNWVCGNLSTGDGGGVAHIGFSYNGDIEHNTILFNQSTNPTIPTNGGGLIVMGAAPDGGQPGAPVGAECGSVTDVDCQPGLSDGAGPGLVINANLILGNAAESGSGGGIRFQDVDGTELAFFPNGNATKTRPNIAPTFVGSNGTTPSPSPWYSVSVTNNIIANNVAGWDGAGVSLQDALAVNFINNTVMSNDSTASSGVLFNTLGAPEASAPGSNCIQAGGTTRSCPQPAGLVTMRNTAPLTASVLALVCPAGHGSTLLQTCKNFSIPILDNDVFWQNRSFYIGVGSLGTGTLNQQNVVSLYNAFANTQAASEPTADATQANGTGVLITGGTGACVTPNAAPNYWDLGVRGDTVRNAAGAGNPRLTPTYSTITDAADYPGTLLAPSHNSASNPTVLSQYCNGSRTPPEFKSLGYQVPPGIADATVPNPIFNLTPTATVDEGNNWINISWGPLSLINTVANTPLGNYGLASSSPAINYIASTGASAANYTEAPPLDFYNNPRKTNGAVDAGAVEFVATGTVAIASVTGGPLAFGNVVVGTTSSAQTLTPHNNGPAATTLTGINIVVTAPFARPAGAAGGTCGVTLAGGGATCTINIVFAPTATGASTGSATVTASVGVTGSPVTLTGTGVAPLVAATLTPTTHNYGTVTRTCPGTTLAQIAACALDPTQMYTLTNTGNVTLTGIGNGVLGGTNATEFTYKPALSTCGPAVGGQLVANTTLAPGGTCVVTVQFQPKTAQTTGLKTATISVTDAAGTQTSTLTGTAN
jgi:hypothetical protein